MESLQQFFTSIPLDWFIIGGIVVILAIDSLRSGIARAISLALSAALASFLFSLFDTALFLKDIAALNASPMAQAIIFIVLIIACFMLLRRMGIEHYESGVGEPVQAILAAVAATAVLILVWVHSPELQGLYEFSGQIQSIFSDAYRFWWILGSFATLTFVRG